MNKNIYRYISWFCAALAIICFLLAMKHFVEERRAGTEYETIVSKETNNTSKEGIVSTETITQIEKDIPAIQVQSIDFESLQKRNPDVYAWIEVPGTNVDYPILQHESDNSYYLTHTIDHENTVAAAIYTENYNAKDFDDLHTVIYGHNMKNKTMFRTLHNYEDYDFFQNNRDVIIYLPEETRYYKVFAAYTYDNRHLLFSYDWSTTDGFQEYIDEIMSIKDFGAYIDKEMDVTGEDKVITLSTCVNSGDSTKRYLVQAVLVSIENNN